MAGGLTYCPNSQCGAQNFVVNEQNPNMKCWNCGVLYKRPPILHIKRVNNKTEVAAFAVVPDLKIAYKDFIKNYANEDIFATVIAHPKNPTVMGVRNETRKPWKFTNIIDEGKEIVIESGKSVVAFTENTVYFDENYYGEFS
jgi:hypothetical protein